MTQRSELAIVHLVVQHRMTMEERAATGILAHESAIVTVLDQGGVGHGLGKSPVHVDLAGRHARAFVDDSLHAPVQFHVRRRLREISRGPVYSFRTDRRVDILIPLRVQVRRPVDRELVADHSEQRLRHGLTAIEPVPVILLHLLYVGTG